MGVALLAVWLVALAALARLRPFRPRTFLPVGVVAIAEIGLLVAFVASDDPDVGGDRPRWDFSRGCATHPFFWISVAANAAAAACAEVQARRLLGVSAAVGTSVGLIAGTLSVYGFSLN